MTRLCTIDRIPATCKKPQPTSGAAYLHLQELLMLRTLRGRQVKLWESEWLTDAVTDVGVEEEGHAPRTQVSVSVVTAIGRVDLGIRPQVAHPLDVNDDHLVAGLLKREVAECLR